MRNEILETIEQLFLSDDTPFNECNHVDDSGLADFYLRFAHLPLNGHQKHPFQQLLSKWRKCDLQVRQSQQVFNENESVHAHLEIALWVHHAFENL